MNTAVPGTRTVLDRSRLSIRSATGSDRSARMDRRCARPRFQVVISVNTTAATAMGTQPPVGTLRTFAVNSARSMLRKKARKEPTWNGVHPKRSRAMKQNRIVVMAMVPVTATPYAAPNAVDDRKENTSSSVPIASALLTSGM